jgi:hypothetical protein
MAEFSQRAACVHDGRRQASSHNTGGNDGVCTCRASGAPRIKAKASPRCSASGRHTPLTPRTAGTFDRDRTITTHPAFGLRLRGPGRALRARSSRTRPGPWHALRRAHVTARREPPTPRPATAVRRHHPAPGPDGAAPPSAAARGGGGDFGRADVVGPVVEGLTDDRADL